NGKSTPPISFYKFLDPQLRNRIRKSLTILRKIQKNKSLTVEEKEHIFRELEINLNDLALHEIKNAIDLPLRMKNLFRKTPIKITNIVKSKGLTFDYVFMVDFDDRFLLEKGKFITDDSIYRFLVALTRARIRAYIFTA